jgi:hypothetical protein
MAVMYQAMLNAYGRNPLALYAETVGALDIATQRANDERQRVELAEAQREAYARAQREAEESREIDAHFAQAEAELSAQERAAAAERERLDAIRRAEEQERARVAREAREARLREPGPLIREEVQRKCMQHAMIRGLRRASQIAHGGAGASSCGTVSAAAASAVEAAVDTWARGVLRRVVRDAAFLKRCQERKPLAGMVVRPPADRNKGRVIQGTRRDAEKRAREDLSRKMEARAEGTDLHEAWQKKRKRYKHHPATFSAEKEGTLDRVAEELLTATVCRDEVRQRYAGQDGLGAMGVTGGGAGAGAAAAGGKFVVAVEVLKRLVSSQRRVEAATSTVQQSSSEAATAAAAAAETRLRVWFSPAAQEAVLNGSILEAVRVRGR